MTDLAPTSDPCPNENVFVALLHGDLTEDERKALDDHLDRCRACTTLLTELGALFASSAEEPEATGPTQPERPQPSAEPAALPRADEGTTKLGGRYAIQRMLGSGGMGTVFEAYDESLGRKVAIKVLRADLFDPQTREEYSARLLREARLLAAVYHPNVLNVYDVGVWKGQVFMATQYVEGTTTREWIAREAPAWSEILEVFNAVGQGLAEAHSQGLVHRDIKPDNILIDPAGRAWLADFGLACAIGGQVNIEGRATDDEGDEAELLTSTLTRSGAVMGTPAYMSPEQHRGEETDERSDQFSFCATLFQALYGVRPFEGQTREALARATSAGAIVKAPAGEVPARIYAVLTRGMAPDPKDRFDAIPLLLEALKDASDSGPRRARILRVLGVIAAILVTSLAFSVVIVVGGFYALSQWAADQPGQNEELALDDIDLSDLEVEPPKPTPEERKAAQRKMLLEAREACLEDDTTCLDLIEKLENCCTSIQFEGVVNEPLYIEVTRGLLDRFEPMCKQDNAKACLHAAWIWSYAHHDYQWAEGNLVPRYMELIRKSCLLGDTIACGQVEDVYAEGALSAEGEFSVALSADELVSVVGAGCEVGEGQSCWFIVEGLTSNKLPKDDKRALPFIVKACERGWPLACVLGGAIWRDLGVEACKEELLTYYQRIPSNDLFDDAASWSDVGAFCKRFSSVKDNAKAKALFETGCKTDPNHRMRTTREHMTTSRDICCERASALETAAAEPNP